MRIQTPKHSRFRRRPVVDEPLFSILIFTATAMGTLTALGLVLPRPIILPAFSLCALAAAAGIALMAYARAAWRITLDVRPEPRRRVYSCRAACAAKEQGG